MDKEASRVLPGYGSEDAIYPAALERVRLVIAWYSARIREEGQAAHLDCERLAQLEAGRRVALADRRLLDRCDEETIRRLHREYGELYLRLRNEEASRDS
jgi:hypothetical protein